MIELLILALVALWLAGSVWYLLRRRKRGCSGCCANCPAHCREKIK